VRWGVCGTSIRKADEVADSLKHTDVSLLLDKLGGLPLALVQAGAYIRARNLTAEKYIAHYEKTWDKLMAYQDRYPLQEYAERSVLTTWKMSYEQVRTVEPRAAMLLDQWAFLHPGEMSYELIEAYNDDSEHVVGEEEEDEALVADELSFLDAVGVLAEYSLVNSMDDPGRFSIHAVVHEWSLYNIADDETRERLCVRAIRMVAASVPSSTVAIGLQAAQRLLSHARLATRRYIEMEKMASMRSELHQVAYFMKDWESSQEVEILYLRALGGYEEALGAKHTSTLDTVNNLGNLYYNLGKMKEAEEMYLRALRGREEALGAKHTSTLSTVNNLGNLYWKQGKMKEAEEMYLRALRGREEALGAKHTSTLDTVNNLGALYWKQGKMKEAEEMYLRALGGYEEALGAKHTSTLDTVNNLGNLYNKQDKMKEAEEMLMRALRGKEEAWGAKHTSTLDTVNNLGILYAKQGKMKEAEEMLMRALRGREEALGAKHTSTLDTVNNLGALYKNQGKMKEAEEMYLRALGGYEEAWGAKHTSTLDTVNDLGNLYRDRGEVAKAKKMYERAVYGYSIVEGDHEANIVYLRRQLSLFGGSDGEADRGCQAVDRQPLISAADIATRANAVTVSDHANGPSVSGAAPVRHRKRDFLLRVLKR
jgi:tetratricopeptide (TPR) repeat protein